MNTLRIIILFLFVFKLNFSQSIFVPLGSYYNYNFYSEDGGTTGIKTLYYTSDTMINTGTCNYPSGNCINEPLAIKENSNDGSNIFNLG